MLPKENRIKKMYEFLQKYYNVFGKIFVSKSIFFDLLEFIECNFEDFTRYYQIFDIDDNFYIL